MKKTMMIALMLCFITTTAHAHIMNRHNIYSDLSLTDAADDIVLLAALHVIQPDGQVFEPTAPLTMKQLAEWVAGYYSLADAQAAVAAGFVKTLNGNATYAAVNEAYFNHHISLSEEQQRELTREEFAKFVASHVNTQVNGQTMLEAANFTEGPTGTIEAATVEHGANVITIDGTSYTLGHHPSVIAASADPAVWIGEHVAESYIGPNSERDYDKHGEEMALQFIVLGNERYTALPAEQQAQTVSVEQALDNVVTQTAPSQKEVHTPNNGIYVVVAFLVIAFIVWLVRRKRNST